MALRASVSADLLTHSSWLANGGYEYWFPRPVSDEGERPVVIVGGGRETDGPTHGTFETDDSVLKPKVGSVLRALLPAVFPGRYEEGGDSNVLMEWVPIPALIARHNVDFLQSGIMGHTSSGDPFVRP